MVKRTLCLFIDKKRQQRWPMTSLWHLEKDLPSKWSTKINLELFITMLFPEFFNLWLSWFWKFFFFGTSFPGYLALIFADNQEDFIQKLSLLSPSMFQGVSKDISTVFYIKCQYSPASCQMFSIFSLQWTSMRTFSNQCCNTWNSLYTTLYKLKMKLRINRKEAICLILSNFTEISLYF